MCFLQQLVLMWADSFFFLPKMIFNALSEQISLDQYLKPHISKKESRFHYAHGKDREVLSLQAASENQDVYPFGLEIMIN